MRDFERTTPLLVTADFTAETGQVEISHCRLVVDDADIGDLGLEFVGTEVDIVRPRDPAPAEGPFVLATTHAGDLHNGSPARAAMSQRVDAVVTERDGLVARRLLSDGNHDFGTLAKVTVGERLVAFGFRPPRPDDAPGGRFLAVVHDLISDQAEIANRGRAEVEHARLLVDALAAIDQIGSIPRVPDPGPAATPSGDHEALVRLRREHDVLERKYHSLSASRLGRMTLRYWNFRKALRKNGE